MTYLIFTGPLSATAEQARVSPLPRRQEIGIQEAVFSYLMDRFRRPDWAPFFALGTGKLGGERRDTDDALMRRFRAGKISIKKYSQCVRQDVNNQQNYHDRVTGVAGVVYEVGAIRWLSRTRAQVDACHDVGMSVWSQGTYLVEKKRGQWRVTRILDESVPGE